jgi:hypothetical protein
MLTAELETLAEEELGQAMSLDWRQLSPLIPWGDVYTGVAPCGQSVEFERSYLWSNAAGGDILCEVRVYLDQARYDQGARRQAVIHKPRQVGQSGGRAGTSGPNTR